LPYELRQKKLIPQVGTEDSMMRQEVEKHRHSLLVQRMYELGSGADAHLADLGTDWVLVLSALTDGQIVEEHAVWELEGPQYAAGRLQQRGH
jgi:hypothetical protein